MSTFNEEVLLLNDSLSLTEQQKKDIQQALANNSAVGIIAGRYDCDLTISFASYYFLKNLGYEYGEYKHYQDKNNHSLLSLIHQDDLSLFQSETFINYKGRLDFKILTKDGLPLYAHAYKRETIDSNGEKLWLLSVRVSWESFDLFLSKEAEKVKEDVVKENDALNDILKAMTKLVVRYTIVDLKKHTYSFYDCGHGARYNTFGTYEQLLNDMDKHLKVFSDKKISEVLSLDTIKANLKSESDKFKIDYAEKDDSAYYNVSVVPMQFVGNELTKFIMLSQDITQTKRIELQSQQALVEACALANRANQAKSDFLANMSHDIRTPMNAIIGMTAIAGAHIEEKERVMDSLEKITSASRHLLSLINDLLDMSQIEKGNVTLNEDDFNLSQLIDAMIDMSKSDLKTHQHNFEVSINNVEHEDVCGDSLKIQQVFTNIMSNAIKYTPDGGNISLTITEKKTNHPKIGCYEFIFQDNGIGMSKEFQEVLFDPFSRDNSTYVKNKQGSGLGMAITKNIVNMMNGNIKVESEIGKGSKFIVTIFLKIQDSHEVDIEELYNLPVLVVDDDPICCDSTVETLKSIGMVGESVTSGQQAIEKTVNRHENNDDYFAIIMDWKMPDMDGIETARQIRQLVGRDVPIIMLSAYDYSDIEQQAREAGVDCFIAKPLFKSRLKKVFEQFVKGDAIVQQNKVLMNQIQEMDLSNKRVLIVEDNELNREIAVELVSMSGCQVETANDGLQAVEMFKQAGKGYYDLILMDIQMPIMDGYEATRTIRKLENGSHTPIIAMTANAFAEDVIKAKNAGFDDHFAKPINIIKLNEILKYGLLK